MGRGGGGEGQGRGEFMGGEQLVVNQIVVCLATALLAGQPKQWAMNGWTVARRSCLVKQYQLAHHIIKLFHLTELMIMGKILPLNIGKNVFCKRPRLPWPLLNGDWVSLTMSNSRIWATIAWHKYWLATYLEYWQKNLGYSHSGHW